MSWTDVVETPRRDVSTNGLDEIMIIVVETRDWFDVAHHKSPLLYGDQNNGVLWPKKSFAQVTFFFHFDVSIKSAFSV